MAEARAQRDRRLIARTAALFSEDYPLDQLIERLCDTLNAEFDATAAAVALDSGDGELRVAGSSSGELVAPRSISRESREYAAFAQREAEVIDSEFGPGIVAPIVHNQRTLGIIAVWCTPASEFDDQDLRMLQAIARLLGIAVRNQRVLGAPGGAWRLPLWIVGVVAALAIGLSVLIASYSMLRAARLDSVARQVATSRLQTVVAQIDTYVGDSRQLNASAVALFTGVRGRRAYTDRTLRSLLQSSTSDSIYGVGVWYAPYAFDPRVRLFGPYAHRQAKVGVAVTSDAMRPGTYDYPERPWYRAGIRADGRLVFTDPYFDLDHVYVTAVRAFRDNDGRIAGVVTVDALLTNLEDLVRRTATEGSFTYIIARDETVIATSDDAGLLAFARGAVPGARDVEHVPLAQLLAYTRRISGDDTGGVSTVVPATRWRAGVAVQRRAFDTDARRLRDITFVAIGGIWLAALFAIVTLFRSRRYVRRARRLEAQRRALEREVAERVRVEERLREYAYRDELTQLANRASVIAHLTSLIERLRLDADDNFALLFIDLDRFNLINDSLGHVTGDALLAEISDRLRGLTKTGDLLARPGGDEFVLVISHTTEERARSRAADVLRALRQPFWLSGHEFYMTASIGIALGDQRYDRPEEVLRDADAAMYEAKRAGRATFRLFDRSMHERAIERLALETDLRRGLSRGEIFVEYQPVFSLADNCLAGFEALARWRHPVRGLMGAETFIPLAEQTGLIVDIDECVMAEACATARAWVDKVPRLFIAVNASAAHLTRIDDLSLIRRALETSGLPPSSLKVEITETAIMEGGEKALAVLARLRELGVGLAIDDFGTGYSSLSYLQRLPIEELKIDRAFVGSMLHSEKAAEIVRAILAIAKALHLRVTAEGVETQEQAQCLARFGIGLAQGYYYGKAMGAQAASELLGAYSERSFGVK